MSDAAMITNAAASADIAVVQRVYDAFARGDVPALSGLFTPDGEIEQSDRLPWSGRYAGHAGLGEFHGKLTVAIASAVTTERYIDDQAGHVVAVGVTRGHGLANGTAFEVPQVHVWTVRDRKIARFASYVDTALMRAALEG